MQDSRQIYQQLMKEFHEKGKPTLKSLLEYIDNQRACDYSLAGRKYTFSIGFLSIFQDKTEVVQIQFTTPPNQDNPTGVADTVGVMNFENQQVKVVKVDDDTYTTDAHLSRNVNLVFTFLFDFKNTPPTTRSIALKGLLDMLADTPEAKSVKPVKTPEQRISSLEAEVSELKKALQMVVYLLKKGNK